jgi:hypothetical protein
MFFLGIMPPQILLDVALADNEVSLRATMLRFFPEFPVQPREADPWTILKLQPVPAKRFRLNCNGEIACGVGRIHDVKRIDARTGFSFETHILNVHAGILSVACVLIPNGNLPATLDFEAKGACIRDVGRLVKKTAFRPREINQTQLRYQKDG